MSACLHVLDRASPRQGHHILAMVGSMRGGAPGRPGLAAMATVSWSGASNPADGGGEGGAVVLEDA
jgi:hypothetical protein